MLFLSLIFTFVVFLILDRAYQDQVRVTRERGAPEVAIQQMIADNNLDAPVLARYARVLTGNFGTSIATGMPVSVRISERLPTTVKFVAAGLVVTFAFAIPMGVLSAIKRNTIVDMLFSATSVLCKSVPFFWLSLLVVLLFSLELGWLPFGETGTIRHYILPAFTLGLSYFGFAMQAIRATTLSALSNNNNVDLIFPQAGVKGGDTYQDAILPTVAKSGFQLGWLFFCIIIVEPGFILPGVGSLLFTGLRLFDSPVILGCIMTLSALFIVVNAVVILVFAGVAFIVRKRFGKRGYEYV